MQTLDIILPHNSPILEVESGLWQLYALISKSQEPSFGGHKHILALTYPKSLHFFYQSRWTKGSWSWVFCPTFPLLVTYFLEREEALNMPNWFHLGTGTVLHQHMVLPECLHRFWKSLESFFLISCQNSSFERNYCDVQIISFVVLIILKDIKYPLNSHWMRVPPRDMIFISHCYMSLMWGRKITMALAVGVKKNWVFWRKQAFLAMKQHCSLSQFLWNIVFKFVSHPWGGGKETQYYSPYIQQDNLESMIGCISLICKGLIHCWPNSFTVAKRVLFPSNQKLLNLYVNLPAFCTKAKKSILLVRWIL